MTFKLDFPGNLCREAFAILAMFLFFCSISDHFHHFDAVPHICLRQNKCLLSFFLIYLDLIFFCSYLYIYIYIINYTLLFLGILTTGKKLLIFFLFILFISHESRRSLWPLSTHFLVSIYAGKEYSYLVRVQNSYGIFWSVEQKTI